MLPGHITRTTAAALAVSIALGVSVSLTTAQPRRPDEGALSTRDPAVDALVDRFRSANNPADAERALEELRAKAPTSTAAALACGTIASRIEGTAGANEAALSCLKVAADAGIPEAQYRLARALLAQGSQEEARRAAVRWLSLSANALPESVYLLALLQADQTADPRKARDEVIRKSAEAGYAPAQHELARRLHLERADSPESRAWLEKASAQGFAEAAYDLATLLEADKREQDIPRIIALLDAASQGGSPRAAYALGMRYLDARGVRRETERALALVRSAALAGYGPGEYAFGFMLGQGLGTGADEAAALAWFRRAAARGHADAMFAIGNSYANAWGVGKSMDVAYQWYCRAASAGSDAARELIKRARPGTCPDTGANPARP